MAYTYTVILNLSRLYSCERLFKILLANGITAVGTLNKRRKGIPDELRDVNGRPVGQYDILYEKDSKLSLHSWVTKSSDKGI